MQNLSCKKTEKILHYFEEISKIPHGSYHIDEISDYLVNFAKKNGLRFLQDKEKNVVIYKEATVGYELEPTVVIQGHMDMVAVCEDRTIDMNVTPIELMWENNYLKANHTSLGADDGIAVAYALAILESNEYSHPALEVLITTNEEVGMDGAIGFEASTLSGTRVLNIDSEEEGIFTVGCAGGVRVESIMVLKQDNSEGQDFFIEVSGLQGGHSGTMIHYHRANACCLLGRFLERISENIDIELVDIQGGTKCNAIPDHATAMIRVPMKSVDCYIDLVSQLTMKLQEEYREVDPELKITIKKTEDNRKSYSMKDTKKVIQLLCKEPDGVVAMSQQVNGLVETSLNLGIVEIKDDILHTYYEIRSCVRTAIIELQKRVISIAESLGARTQTSAAYPEWSYREESILRDKMCKVYHKMYQKDPKVMIVHAGLECGVLAEKMKDFDGVSFGPNILDIHTTKERLDWSSVERVWNYLLELLATKDDQIEVKR